MGCDIHMYAEIYDEKKKKWEHTEHITKIKYEDGWETEENILVYSGRNYDLFAILADVRNGYGFAGHSTGGGFNPISMPKGLPSDVSSYVKKQSDEWNGDGHSHSWFTVKELLDYDWDQGTYKYGWVTPLEYHRWKYQGEPNSYCGDISGGRIVKLSNEEMDYIVYPERSIEEWKKGMEIEEIIKKRFSDIGILHYTHVEWKTSYRLAARHFLNTTLPNLMALGDPDKVRIVFWFDN